MSPLPSMPLLVDRFIADTAHMSVEEVGAHIRLLMFAWRSAGCCLPDDDARLARMLGTTLKRWISLKPAVIALWHNHGGNYTNNRLTQEHQFVTNKIETKRAAGRLGGRPKSLKLRDEGKALGLANEKRNESQPKASTLTSKKTPLSPSGEEAEGFDRFKLVYPARNVRFPTTQAWRRWLEAREGKASAEEIIAAARAYAAEQIRVGKVGTEFVKTADAWLHQGRWKDYVTTPPMAAPPSAAVTDETWRQRVQLWRARGGYWPWRPCEPPDDLRTMVPQHILVEFGISKLDVSAPLKLTGTS